MKYLILTFFLIAGAYAQAPEGWKTISEAEEKKENSQFLGSWKSPDGTIEVQATRFTEKDPPPAVMLGFAELLDNNSMDIDESIFPIQIETLKHPRLGIRFKLAPTEKLFREKIWLQTTTGGVSIEIDSTENTQFTLRNWIFGKLPSDKDKTIRLHYERRLAELKPFMKGPRSIKIDKRLIPPISDSKKAIQKGPRLRISIHKDGRFSIDNKFHNEEQLLEAMKKAAQSAPDTVLHLRSDSHAEFKFARKVIKLGAKAGLSQVAFGAFPEEQKSK